MAYSQPAHSGIYRERGRKGNGEYMNSYQKRQAWTKEEDEILKQQVSRLGTHCWPDVASGLPGRTSKACSLRWRCFLSPTIIRPNEQPFSEWEIAVIVLTQKMFGNKWNDIAAYLPMRCNNDIKNHFNLYLKDKQHQVALENSYLRQGYDLANLLQAEPEEVASRREKLEKERVTSNDLEHGAVKSPNRSSAFIRPRASPTKPKPSPRFSPYHLALAEAAAGQGTVTGITSSASGAGSADSDTASPSSQHAYSAYSSGHSIGKFDALGLTGGFRAQSALAAAGLPSSLLYGGPYSHCATGLAGFLPTGTYNQDPAADANSMCAAYHLAGYTAVPVLSSSSGANDRDSPIGAAVDECPTRQPSRLALAGHPGDLSDYMCGHRPDSSLSYCPGQFQHQQGTRAVLELEGSQHQEQQTNMIEGCPSAQAGLPMFIGVGGLEHMPSLPEPAEQGILEGGDVDGTSLRGIFSSDDGEAHLHQHKLHKQPILMQLSSSDLCLPGIDVAAAAGAASGSEDASPVTLPHLRLGPENGLPSPSSLTSSGASPMHNLQQQGSNASAGHVDVQQLQQEYSIRGGCTTVLVAAGPAAVAPAVTTYLANTQDQQYQQQPGSVPEGAFVADGREAYQYEQHQQHNQGYAMLSDHQQLSSGRYTPFGHPQNQQHHLHQIYNSHGYLQQQQQRQQQMVSDYEPYQQTSAVEGFDSGKSSHHNEPATIAQSVMAAVARLAEQAQGWGANLAGVPVKLEQAAAAQQQQQQGSHQQQQHADMLHLLPRTPSVDLQEELGPLADLLGDHSGDADDHRCNPALDEDLLAAVQYDGQDDHHHRHHHHHHDMAHLDLLPGLTRQDSELEMMATATCW